MTASGSLVSPVIPDTLQEIPVICPILPQLLPSNAEIRLACWHFSSKLCLSDYFPSRSRQRSYRMQRVTKAIGCTCRYKSFNSIPPSKIHYCKVSSISDSQRLKYLFTTFNATNILHFMNRISLSRQTIDIKLKFEQMRWNKTEGVRMICVSSQKNVMSRNLFMTQTITKEHLTVYSAYCPKKRVLCVLEVDVRIHSRNDAD